jgi:hypothetical protein
MEKRTSDVYYIFLLSLRFLILINHKGYQKASFASLLVQQKGARLKRAELGEEPQMVFKFVC